RSLDEIEHQQLGRRACAAAKVANRHGKGRRAGRPPSPGGPIAAHGTTGTARGCQLRPWLAVAGVGPRLRVVDQDRAACWRLQATIRVHRRLGSLWQRRAKQAGFAALRATAVRALLREAAAELMRRGLPLPRKLQPWRYDDYSF